MFLIGSKRGFMVAFLSIAAGFLAAISAGAIGAASKGVAIGVLAMGGVAYLLGRHEPERNQFCSLFFIPLRFWAVVLLVCGAVFFFVPTPAPSADDTKLAGIEARLKSETASGSSAVAAEKAAGYQRALLGFEKLSGITGKVSVFLELDATDFKDVRKASLYVQSENLRKYGEPSKKALISICLKMMRADFPAAACNAAARGPILWGVRGSSVGSSAEPVLLVDSTSPRF